MKRIFPKSIHDKMVLSKLLNQYIDALMSSPLDIKIKALSFDTDIPESIFYRLMYLHQNPDDAIYIDAEDFHILFSNIMFRYPTVKIWQHASGEYLFEI